MRLSIGGKHAYLYKNKRARPAKLNTNKYLVKQKVSNLDTDKSPVEQKPQRQKPKRAPYFYHFRNERMALRTLENTFTIVDNRSTYRANRYLYYFVIPHLAKYLWHPPDRDRLMNVERDLYNELLSYRYRRNHNIAPDRVELWSFRIPTIEDGQ